jgi:hypothetical protein
VNKKNLDDNKITEEELVDFWNSSFFPQQNAETKSNKEDVIHLPESENDLKKIIFDITKQVEEKNLSNAYNITKYLLNKISKTMMDNKETMKVVINDGYGGFALSEEAKKMLAELQGKKTSDINEYSENLKRHDADLIRVVEYFGKKSGGICSQLKIVEIPKNIEYTISEYDGWETVVY